MARARWQVAIVHERITEYAGSERVVEELHALWPDAPVHVPILDRRQVPPALENADLRTSGLQAIYRGGRTYAHLLPLLPLAMSRFRLEPAKVVIASHHAFANRVQPPTDATLVSYTHTPARWMWDTDMLMNEPGGPIGQGMLKAFAASQRPRDAAAAHRVDLLVVNSAYVARRAAEWWGRSDAVVVHPPVDVDYFTVDPTVAREDFFLLAGRLVPYKRPELRSCTALLLPGKEDFGILAVEAQACGTPVIAVREGGYLETVLPDVTGVLYEPGPNEIGALADAIRSFQPGSFDPAVIRRHAEKFAPTAFRAGFLRALAAVTDVDALEPAA
jgi:glycosyltransferase involved in cell wall biosynthesis